MAGFILWLWKKYGKNDENCSFTDDLWKIAHLWMIYI
jgi:hypothetical protein